MSLMPLPPGASSCFLSFWRPYSSPDAAPGLPNCFRCRRSRGRSSLVELIENPTMVVPAKPPMSGLYGRRDRNVAAVHDVGNVETMPTFQAVERPLRSASIRTR